MTLVEAIGDKLTELQSRFTAPLFKARGIDLKVTHNREERVALLTNFFRGATEIKMCVGPDPGELDEIAEALIASGAVSENIPRLRTIRVTQTPLGTAPQEYREAWKKVESLPAFNAADLKLDPAPEREAYAVPTGFAIQALRETNPEAAQYFLENLPPDEFPILTFGADEVEVV